MSSHKGRKATIIYGPSLADPGGDETPVTTAEDKKIAFDDLKVAMRKFSRKDESVYKAQLEALNDPKNRRRALAERMPALEDQTEEMAQARENVLNGLEMIDLLEQIDIIDTMIGDLGTLERQIHDQISIFIRKGCTIEALIGTPMKPHGKFFWKVPPENPYESAESFLQECRVINNLKKLMIRVTKISDEAEAEGTIWGNKLKKFNKKIDFFDPLAEQVFTSIAESLEEDHIQQLNTAHEIITMENEIEQLEKKIQKMDQSATTVFTLENDETLTDLYQKQKKLSKKKRGRPSKADKEARVSMLIQIEKLEAMEERFETEQNELQSFQKKLKEKKKLLNRLRRKIK